MEVCGAVHGGVWRDAWRHMEGAQWVHEGVHRDMQRCTEVHKGVHRGMQRCTEVCGHVLRGVCRRFTEKLTWHDVA